MLKQLIYVSFTSPHFQADDIGRILAASHRNNPTLGITGLLIIKNNLFLQALEGETEAVRDLFNKIREDVRHKDISIISWEAIEKRDFPNWSMGFKNLDDLPTSGTTGLVDFTQCSVEDLVQNPSGIHALFQSLVEVETEE